MDGAEAGIEFDGRAAFAELAAQGRMAGSFGDAERHIRGDVSHACLRVNIGIQIRGDAQGYVAEAGFEPPIGVNL